MRIIKCHSHNKNRKVKRAVENLLASEIDNIKLAAFIAAFFVNRQAIVIVAFHIVGQFLFDSTDSGLIASCLLAALYSLNATINIKLSFEIRQALICVAFINWLAAVDYFVSPNETVFYMCYPWLINGLDVFILAYLLSNGGRSFAGYNRPFFGRLNCL